MPGHEGDALAHLRHHRQGSRRERRPHHRRQVLRRSYGRVVGHVAPEAAGGGTIGLFENGERIAIDAENLELSVDLSDEDLTARRSRWALKPRKLIGTLAKYAALVSSASAGAITDPGGG